MISGKPFFRLILFMTLLIFSCQGKRSDQKETALAAREYSKGSYGYDAAFMKKYWPHTLELKDSSGEMRILVSPEYQGRVMTSSSGSDSGLSYGWLNYDLIAGQRFKPQFNPVGGEERFWLGPEGGQYALYFKKGDSFNLKHWQVPPVLDTLPFEVQSADARQVVFKRKASLQNFSGSSFPLEITRMVRLMDRAALAAKLGVRIPDNIRAVAFESNNRIANTGDHPWNKQGGLLSIWLLGMMTPTEQTYVFIPFKPGAHSREFITDNYFGEIPPNRLQVRDSILFFRCDGKFRSKIGLSPRIAGTLAASFDFARNVLTILSFAVDPQGMYVNSKWEMQKQPYAGDVVNAYNDGPLAGGGQLGPFYEIESSSPAKELKPGEFQEHHQLTCHLQGDYNELRNLVKTLFGLDLESLKKM